MEIQENVLFTILNDNKDTEFGRTYGFADIHTIEDFQKAVPVSSWSAFEPLVDRMLEGEQNILTVYPFDHFTTTSGTSGMPIYDFCVYPDYDEKRYCFLVEPLPDSEFILQIFGDKLQEEMENISEKYLVVSERMGMLQPLSLQRLQPSACLLRPGRWSSACRAHLIRIPPRNWRSS